MLDNVLLFLPETAALLAGLAVLIAVLAADSARSAWITALIGAVATVGVSAWALGFSGEPFFPGIYRVDLFSQLLKLGLAVGLLLVLLLSRELESVRPDARPEAPLFLIVTTAGMMLLVSATELLTLYLALELSAYGLYLAVAVQRDPALAGETGARYVLMGATSSAVTLYGLSLVYGVTGSTYLSEVTAALSAAAPDPLLIVGLLLVFAALFFKLAVFPFHFWAPDVYQGGAHQMVAFVATTSKLGAVGVLARICALLVGREGGSIELFMVLSVASMTLGNLAAIGQTDLKRLIAYSAVAHAGYLMLGYSAFSELGLASALFYGLTYLAMAHLAFVVICAVGRDGSAPTLESLTGLHQRAPGLALMLLTAMFGLGGIPPTAGFVGKWFLFAAALQRQQFVLVLIAALNATVALYYYLRVIKAAYLAPAEGRAAIEVGWPSQIAGYVSLTIVLAAGIYPAPLWVLAQRAAAALLG